MSVTALTGRNGPLPRRHADRKKHSPSSTADANSSLRSRLQSRHSNQHGKTRRYRRRGVTTILTAAGGWSMVPSPDVELETSHPHKTRIRPRIRPRNKTKRKLHMNISGKKAVVLLAAHPASGLADCHNAGQKRPRKSLPSAAIRQSPGQTA